MTITTAASVLAIFAVFIPFFNVGCNRLKTEKLSGHFFIYHCFSLFLPCSKVYFFTSSFKVKTFCKITYLLSYTMGCFLSKKKEFFCQYKKRTILWAFSAKRRCYCYPWCSFWFVCYFDKIQLLVCKYC